MLYKTAERLSWNEAITLPDLHTEQRKTYGALISSAHEDNFQLVGSVLLRKGLTDGYYLFKVHALSRLCTDNAGGQPAQTELVWCTCNGQTTVGHAQEPFSVFRISQNLGSIKCLPNFRNTPPRRSKFLTGDE